MYMYIHIHIYIYIYICTCVGIPLNFEQNCRTEDPAGLARRSHRGRPGGQAARRPGGRVIAIITIHDVSYVYSINGM